MALGADRGAVRRLVGRQIFAVTATGLGLGLMAALFAARLVAPFLYAISPRDPIAIGVTCAALLGLVAAASYLPLRRATAVDPAEALRTE
jgi:ABC-type antimicrobial peptide transport system permease subunit